MFPPVNCSGCGACFYCCPTNAIAFLKDREGFYYPEIDPDKCINCGLCERKCPVLQEQDTKNISSVAYACQNNDTNVRKCSSSGGVFSTLAECILKTGGIVVGCTMTEDCYNAEHRSFFDEIGLNQLRGSKYLQSTAYIVYPEICDALKSGKTVLFSGTPCQIAGLNAYLSDVDTQSLITVDVICHGVPSPEVWRQYVKYHEAKQQSKVVSVQFRNKDKGWKSYSVKFSFENGNEYSSLAKNDLFYRGFVTDCFLRRSCYDCHAKGDSHIADITLGDFWGVQNFCDQMDDNLGTSLVILNSEKGKALFQNISSDLKYQQVDFKDAVKYNPSYNNSSSKIVNRDRFMKGFHKKQIISQLEKYCGDKITSRINRKIRLFLSNVYLKCFKKQK